MSITVTISFFFDYFMWTCFLFNLCFDLHMPFLLCTCGRFYFCFQHGFAQSSNSLNTALCSCAAVVQHSFILTYWDMNSSTKGVVNRYLFCSKTLQLNPLLTLHPQPWTKAAPGLGSENFKTNNWFSLHCLKAYKL